MEDEDHMFFNCPFYQEHRIKFLTSVIVICPKMFENSHSCILQGLFNSDNDSVLFCMGKFIQKCFKHRS